MKLFAGYMFLLATIVMAWVTVHGISNKSGYTVFIELTIFFLFLVASLIIIFFKD